MFFDVKYFFRIDVYLKFQYLLRILNSKEILRNTI